MDNLVIYKASAGSGKTFKLTEEYLRLAFKIPFYRILAVTFTNKATAEMKFRITDELDKLSSGGESHYLDVLMADTGMNENSLRQKAGALLNDILQNYSIFSVGTIDSFFQQIIRGFAKEMGLQSGFELELDNGRVLDKVTDRLMIETTGNIELQNWLTRYAESRIREGKSWNFRDDIGRLGQQVFSETFMQFRNEMTEKLSDRSFMDDYLKSLDGVRKGFEGSMVRIGASALEMIEKHGLTVSDFLHGSRGVAGYFEKIAVKKSYEPGKRAIAAAEDPEAWAAKKSSKKDELMNIVDGGLDNLLEEALSLYNKEYPSYLSASLVMSNFYTLGILNDISGQVREYSDENNLFLLSDVVSFLSEIIEGNDAPFIYEKTGYFYKNFMIDEFQDTSRLQWKNFIPLITDSLAGNNRNILVGDVKQSIYRWRNGDWKILATEAGEEMKRFGLQTKSLEINWRSRRTIVEFNNSVFNYAPLLLQRQFMDECRTAGFSGEAAIELQEQIGEAYRDHFQKMPAGNSGEGGLVCADFINNEDGAWKEGVSENLPGLLTEILSRGYRPGDIAILVRNNRDGKKIASTLLAWQAEKGNRLGIHLDFISGEFLLLQESVSVQLLLAVMSFLVNPDDNLNTAVIINEYCRYLKYASFKNVTDHELFGNISATKGTNLEYFMPVEFVRGQKYLSQLSLYEMVEKLISIFELNKLDSEIPYLMAFQDVIIDYLNKEAGGSVDFLGWWDENGDNQSVSSNDKQDAIKIMTIYKAKGLQFKVVVIPFADWKIDHDFRHDNFLWCRPDRSPFRSLELVPVKYKADLAKSIFAPDYFSEKMQVFVDNLNLLYVAFTRSEEELHVFMPLPAEKQQSDEQTRSISELLFSILPDIASGSGEDDTVRSGEWHDAEKAFRAGSSHFPVAEPEKAQDNQLLLDKYHIYEIRNKPGLRLYGTLLPDKKSEPGKGIDHGKLMHEIFEGIIDSDDVEKAVKKRCYEGKISTGEAGEIIRNINNIIGNKDVVHWFDGSWKVRNETAILLKDGETRRPDRVMTREGITVVVDYKFGEQVQERYRSQMRKYLKVIRSMGYENVRGIVWYVTAGLMDEVSI